MNLQIREFNKILNQYQYRLNYGSATNLVAITRGKHVCCVHFVLINNATDRWTNHDVIFK